MRVHCIKADSYSAVSHEKIVRRNICFDDGVCRLQVTIGSLTVSTGRRQSGIMGNDDKSLESGSKVQCGLHATDYTEAEKTFVSDVCKGVQIKSAI